MAFDPLQPYGPVVESSVRMVTWNVWGRHGEWHQRQAALEAALEKCQPDVVCLAESWSAEETSQAEAIAGRLGVPHSLFVGDWKEEGWTSGIGIVSRWPIARREERPLPGDDGGAAGTVLFVALDGPRGPLQVFVAMLDYPLDVWEVAGDGSPGITWSNKNPLAAIGRYPDRRFDYVFSAWPRAGAAGHPTHCQLLGVAPEDGVQISDHYGVLADLRY